MTSRANVAIGCADRLDMEVTRVKWRIAASALDPGRAYRMAPDPHWERTYLTARADGMLAGLLTMFKARGPSFPDSIFHPKAMAPGVFGTAPDRANQYLLIGGATDLVAGVATAASLPDDVSDEIGAALVDEAHRYARESGLYPASLYVRDEQMGMFRGNRAHETMETFAVLEAGGSESGYLESLKHSRRSVVLRDWRKRDAVGCLARCEPAAEVVAEAAPLVAQVNLGHAVQDHPDLAAYRLACWSAEQYGTRVAFVVRDAHEAMVAVTFGCHWGDILELTEIGLVANSPLRQLAYSEVLVYAPLRYAASAGCRQIHLGMGSPTPKQLRGATFAPVWAVGAAHE